jgi:hypothetical protein
VAILDIEFEWPVAITGYTLRRREGRITLLSAPGIPGSQYHVEEIVPLGTETRRTRPLALNRELYLRFADLEDKPAAFVNFATAWGILTQFGIEHGAESVGDWSRHLRLFKSAVALAQSDPRSLVHFEPEGPGTRMEPGLVARLVWTGRVSLRITPRSLLHALWLQLYQAVTQGSEVKSCDRCGRWFERGAGTERGRKARFCSDTCRFGFHNERRKGGSP